MILCDTFQGLKKKVTSNEGIRKGHVLNHLVCQMETVGSDVRCRLLVSVIFLLMSGCVYQNC